jgi:hypothetical protein
MNLNMSVTVWLKISDISTDDLNHVCYCVVEDLRYYYRPEISNPTVTLMAKFICRYT